MSWSVFFRNDKFDSRSVFTVDLPSLTTIIAKSKSLYFVSTITIKSNTYRKYRIIDVPNVKRADLGDASQGLIKCEVSGSTENNNIIFREY